MPDLLKPILNLDVVRDVNMGVVDPLDMVGVALAVKYKPIFQG